MSWFQTFLYYALYPVFVIIDEAQHWWDNRAYRKFIKSPPGPTLFICLSCGGEEVLQEGEKHKCPELYAVVDIADIGFNCRACGKLLVVDGPVDPYNVKCSNKYCTAIHEIRGYPAYAILKEAS